MASSSPPANKLESAVAAAAAGPGPGPPPPLTALASGRRRRRWGKSSKRGRDDDEVTNAEHHGEDPAAAARPRHRFYKRRKKKQQSGTSMLVTSAPDLFDGYQWRKYGQKQIEGAMYPRSYYRCPRGAEQGCAAKRTVQRNDDAGAAAVPKYTVVRVGEHTCTANDSTEAPVILETTAVAGVPATCTSNNSTIPASASASAAASCSTAAAAAAATEPPAICDNTLSGSRNASSDCYCYVDDDNYDYSGLFAAVHDWIVPALAAPSPSSSSFPRIEDFTGPIRSPVHISAPDGWTIDHQLLLQLVNEPAICHCQHL